MTSDYVLRFGKVRTTPKGNKVYITNRSFNTHFMKKYVGYGISESQLYILKNNKVNFIQINEGVNVYLFELDQYLNGVIYDNLTDKGNDRQRFVSIRESINYNEQ